jgi:ABC-type amino acid transport substrate-binding protein
VSRLSKKHQFVALTVLVPCMLAAVAVAAAGCGTSGTGANSTCGSAHRYKGINVPSAAQSPAVAKICEQGKALGGMAPFSPFAFQDIHGKYLGPAIEVIGPGVAKAIGVPFKIIPIGWNTIVAGLQAGRYNMITAGLTFTPERTKVINFANYSVGGTCYLVKKNSKIRRLSQLNDPSVTIGIITGQSWETKLPQQYPKAKLNVVAQAPGGQFRPEDVLAGRIAVAPIDSVVARAFAANWPALRVVPAVARCIAHPDNLAPIGIGIPKGDPAFEKLVLAVIHANAKQTKALLAKYTSAKYQNVGNQ